MEKNEENLPHFHPQFRVNVEIALKPENLTLNQFSVGFRISKLFYIYPCLYALNRIGIVAKKVFSELAASFKRTFDYLQLGKDFLVSVHV